MIERTVIPCGCGNDAFNALSHPDKNRVAIVCPDCETTMWVITRD